MGGSWANIVRGVAGFGLCKTALALAYLTAMGSVSSTVGFVSALSFMVPMLATSLVVALVLVALAARDRLSAGSLPQLPAVGALVLGFALSATGALSALSVGMAAAICGVLCGFASSVLNAAWIEVFASEPSAAKGVLQMVGGFVVQCVFVLLLAAAPSLVTQVLSMGAAVVSAALLARIRRATVFPIRIRIMPQSRSDRLTLMRALLCVFVLVAVVGVLHTGVLGSQSEHVVGDVSMGVPLVIATAVTALLAAIATHSPNPTLVYRGCFPVLLLVLSLLPFFGETLGSLVGLVVIACYDVCGMVVLIYVAACSRRLEVSTYGLSSLYLAGSSLFLLLGLAAGGLLRSLSADFGLSLLTLLAFAALYPLAVVLMVVLRPFRGENRAPDASPSLCSEGEVSASDGSDQCESGDTPDAQASEKDATDAALRRRIDLMATEYGLTPRECEIAVYLARGRSAKFIAEDLVISENTTWAHIKRIYAKTGLHGKQEFMSAVEKRQN
ncbi:MAG: helix-turn-helix transcriptional regulator [Adlercreutzia sp.]|nr:helix-turn-helix transcriptional regulator [Adlercreutzia sp.]